MIAVAFALLVAAQAQMTATLVEGPVTAAGKAIAEGAELHEGEVVETGAGGRVEISLASGSILRLGEDSKLTLGTAMPQRSFSARLALGNLWAKVHKLLAGETFEIETENAVAGVRGTEFRVEAGEEDLVRVYEGAVQVDARQGRWSHKVVPGNELRFARDRDPSGPRAFDPGSEKGHKFMDWVRSRRLRDGSEPGRIRRSEFRNPEQEDRRLERKRERRREREH